MYTVKAGRKRVGITWRDRFVMKKKTIIILIVLLALVAAALLLWRFVFSQKEDAGSTEDAVYVVTVAELTGQDGALGVANRFAGVVEAQETWSVNQNPDATVKEILVSVGDEVKTGDTLFTYDTEKFLADQEQAEIELERMTNELDAITKMIEQLQADQKKAKAEEQADYTIRIQDAELQKKQKELDIKSKNLTISKLIESQSQSAVTSEIDGVVRSINDGTSSNDYMDGTDSNAFMTIMKTGSLRVKGTINEQHIGQIMVGSPVIVHSRVDDAITWRGSISEINTDSTVGNQNAYYGAGDSGSNYHFYVALDSAEDMMIGQHVYLEPDIGQGEENLLEGLWIPSYMVDLSDPEQPVVWADENGKLARRPVETGVEDEELMMVEILGGLEQDDAIAFPEETLQEGMRVSRGEQS